tara:strand:+ start:36 stop:791 length:756 start_codon:yes stop_codon:yes gene_type:complete
MAFEETESYPDSFIIDRKDLAEKCKHVRALVAESVSTLPQEEHGDLTQMYEFLIRADFNSAYDKYMTMDEDMQNMIPASIVDFITTNKTISEGWGRTPNLQEVLNTHQFSEVLNEGIMDFIKRIFRGKKADVIMGLVNRKYMIQQMKLFASNLSNYDRRMRDLIGGLSDRSKEQAHEELRGSQGDLKQVYSLVNSGDFYNAYVRMRDLPAIAKDMVPDGIFYFVQLFKPFQVGHEDIEEKPDIEETYESYE